MGLGQGDVPLVLIGVQGTALAMLFVWSLVSRRYGKKVVYFMGSGLWDDCSVWALFSPPPDRCFQCMR